MNCVYYSLNNFFVEYSHFRQIGPRKFNKETIKNKNEYIDLFKKSINSVKKHNTDLDIKIFSTEEIEGLDVEIFKTHEENVKHKYLHFDKLQNYQNVLYLNYNVLITNNLNRLFEKYFDGVYMRFKNNCFNDDVMFINKNNMNLYLENNQIDLKIKPIDIGDVGLGGDECLDNVQVIKNYY